MNGLRHFALVSGLCLCGVGWTKDYKIACRPTLVFVQALWLFVLPVITAVAAADA